MTQTIGASNFALAMKERSILCVSAAALRLTHSLKPEDLIALQCQSGAVGGE